MKRFWRRRNRWIALALLAANGLAWLSALSLEELPEVEPRLHPEMAAIREKYLSGEASGEPFYVEIDEQMAAEGVAWFLSRRPGVPFSRPRVEIDPTGVAGWGLAHVFGLRTQVYGRASATLRDGVPVVTLEELGVAGATIPGFIRDAIQEEVEAQFELSADTFPLIITRLEFREGVMIMEGVYR